MSKGSISEGQGRHGTVRKETTQKHDHNFSDDLSVVVDTSIDHRLRDNYLELLKNALEGRTEVFYNHSRETNNNMPLGPERCSMEQNAILKFSGYNRATHIQHVAKRVLETAAQEDHTSMTIVEGDFCECGSYLGGMSIFMAGLLEAYGQSETRTMWVADTFEGMPSSEGHWEQGQYKGTLALVENHFRNFNLWNETKVKLLKGLFNNSLPSSPIKKLAFLHVDCDTYSATMDVLENLYPRMSRGGYIVFDDYHDVFQQKRAVLEYKERMKIQTEVETVEIPGYETVGRWRVE